MKVQAIDERVCADSCTDYHNPKFLTNRSQAWLHIKNGTEEMKDATTPAEMAQFVDRFGPFTVIVGEGHNHRPALPEKRFSKFENAFNYARTEGNDGGVVNITPFSGNFSFVLSL